MTKLATIEAALRGNAEIEIVHVKNPPLGQRYRRATHDTHYVEYIVAPVKGIYEVTPLNELFDGLIPDLEPCGKVPFSDDNPYDVMFIGVLAFQEKIGEATLKRTVVMSDLDEPLVPEFVAGRLEETEEYPIWRFIRIQMYPDVKMARERMPCHEDDNERVPLSEIRKHRPPPPKPVRKGAIERLLSWRFGPGMPPWGI